MIVFKEKKYFFWGCVLLLAVVAMNIFPKGYVAVDGDVSQFIPTEKNLEKYLYDWQGRAAPFFYFFYFLSSINVPLNIQLSFYLGLFIFGAYLSFYFFSGLVLDLDQKKRTLLSLIYAFNLFTLYAMRSVFGYSNYYFIYIFIPILTGLVWKFLREGNRMIFFVFFLITLFISSGFGNPAYALASAIFFLILLLFLFITGELEISTKTLKRLVLLALAAFLANAYWIFPLVPQIGGGLENLSIDNPLKLNWWVYKNSNPIIYTMRMMHDDYRDFPQNSPYSFKLVFSLFTLIPIFLISFRTFFKKYKNKRIFWAFFGTLLVFILFTAKTKEPFEVINYYVYNLWGFSTLRAYEKIAIFIPFLILGTLAFLLEGIKKHSGKISGLLLLTLLVSLPFFTGNLHEGKESKFLSKIPEEYYDIQKIINTDNSKISIGILPYNEESGFGWSSYPKWDLRGVDITLSLYNKRAIEPNRFYFGGWMAARDLSESDKKDQKWIVKLLGMMNAKYLLYHKDISEEGRNLVEYKIKFLENSGEIKKIKDNDYFTLYEIDNKYFIPYITWQKGNINIEKNSESVENNFEKIKEAVTATNFQEINSKKYLVDYISDYYDQNIVLSEEYSTNWKAYAIDSNGKETEIKNHFVARGYANGWNVENYKNAKKIIIEYYPIRLMWRGIFVSLATVLFIIIYLLRYYYAKNFRKNKKINLAD